MKVSATLESPAMTPPAFVSGRGLTLSPTLALTLAVVGYRILVDVGYRTLVATPFAYQGFMNAPTAGSMLLSWAFLLALLPLLVRLFRAETFSAQMTTVLGLISLVPTTTLIAHDPQYSAWYVLLIFVYWLLFLLASVFLPAIQPFRRPFRSEAPHLVVLGALSATVMFISWRYTGFRLHFGLFDVYDIRVEAREFELATILGYLATFADNVLPILVAYYLRRRWYLLAATVGVVILFNFGITATKQVLFLLMFALASLAVGEPARLNRKVLAALALVIVAGMIEQRVLGTLFVGTLSLYRVLAIPAQLHWIHYEFFQTRELLNLTQSALKFFFESPYRDNVQFLVAEYHTGQFGGRANNGLFTDGYMNFGAISVLFYPVMCVALLKLVEGASRDLSSSVRFMLVVSLSFVFLGLPIPTVILSAGVGLLIILLPTLPRRDGGVVAGAPT